MPLKINGKAFSNVLSIFRAGKKGAASSSNTASTAASKVEKVTTNLKLAGSQGKPLLGALAESENSEKKKYTVLKDLFSSLKRIAPPIRLSAPKHLQRTPSPPRLDKDNVSIGTVLTMLDADEQQPETMQTLITTPRPSFKPRTDQHQTIAKPRQDEFQSRFVPGKPMNYFSLKQAMIDEESKTDKKEKYYADLLDRFRAEVDPKIELKRKPAAS